MGDHEASVPISPVPQVSTRVQLARSLGTFVSLFSKARGLRRQSSSWCTQLSWVQTPRTLIKSLEPCSAHRRASWGALGCLPHRLRNAPEMFHALRRHPPVFADFLRASV